MLSMPLHEPANVEEFRDPVCEQHNARLGLVLFAIYLSAYAAFVLLSAFQSLPIDSVLAGMLLIIGAIILSLVYTFFCKTATQKNHLTSHTQL